MTSLAFCDTETTGLDPERHEVWEVGLILRDSEGIEVEHTWQLPVDLGRAESVALKVGNFYERRWDYSELTRPVDFAEEFAELTHGAHLVGAVPSFDDAFLKVLLRRNRACPGWHYHLVDVEALAAGRLAAEPPWKSNELSGLVGVDADNYDRHTALGDARWARDIYDAVMNTQSAAATLDQEAVPA